MTRTILCAALSASAFLGAATVAHAEDGQIRVRISDLNLANADGAQDALERIHYRAEVFCEANGGKLTLQRSAAADRCVAELTHRSVAQLDAPMVTALYDGSSYAPQVLLAQR
ncbi:UrcA family protein [Phenylobacterium sp. LjRoot219]|uniref:UrcA family protein n=1 Tax=Phenylobacterium sp. LjRoot219 TaxID=3342283 RepID=UPI003ED03BF5